MLKSLCFGQFIVHVYGSKDLLNSLPSVWQKYEQNVLNPITEDSSISLWFEEMEEDLFPFSEMCPEGWFVIQNADDRIVSPRIDNQMKDTQADEQVLKTSSNEWILKPNLEEAAVSSDSNCLCQIAYSSSGKALFIIRYRTSEGGLSKDLTILVNTTVQKSVLLGLQYGLLIGLHRLCVGLHGVTLLCGNKMIILSAPSGTGKTTLAHLLEQYCEAIVINGDFALLSILKEDVIFEPTPLCGTSRRCLNHRVRIDSIVFLEQAEENILIPLDGRQALIRCLNNGFIPEWDRSMCKAVQDNIMRILAHVKVYSFAFAPTREAALLFFTKLCVNADI